MADRQHVQFTIWERHTAEAAALLGSGTMDSVGKAMHAAEAMAMRFGGVARNNPLVIVVDDDEAVGGAVADALRDEGCHVMEATRPHVRLR